MGNAQKAEIVAVEGTRPRKAVELGRGVMEIRVDDGREKKYASTLALATADPTIWKSVVMDDRRGLFRSESSPIDKSLFRGTLMGAVEGVMVDPPGLGWLERWGWRRWQKTCCLVSRPLPSKLLVLVLLLYRSC